jgi:hypothetical protein
MKAAPMEEDTDVVPPPTLNTDDDTAQMDSQYDAQAEDVEIIREIADTQMTLKEQMKQSLIDTGFDLDIGGVHIYDWKESGYAIPLVLLYNAVFLMSFFYFCYTFTLTTQAEQYLSLQGSSMYQSCNYVPLQVTGRFEADVYGNWATANAFQQNMSIFQLDMVGTQVTEDQYKKIMSGFQAQLKALSDKSARRDAGWNAMAWATYIYYDAPSSMTFFASADATIIYDNAVSMAVLTSAKAGICKNLYQYGSFDPATTTIAINAVIQGNMTKVLEGYDPISAAKEACPGQFLAHQWLDSTHIVVPEWDTPGLLHMEFDMNTAITAISLNMGISQMSSFTQVSSAYGASGAAGVPGTWLINSFVAPMDPIFCLDVGAYRKKYKISTITDSQVTGPPVCFIVQGPIDEPIFYYPMTASYYTLPDTGQFAHCACPEDGTNPQCNGRDFLIAFFYDMNHTLSQVTNSFTLPLKLQKLLVDDPVNGDYDMQQYVSPLLESAYYIANPFGTAWYDVTHQSYTKNGKYYDYNFMHGTYANTHKTEWMNICPWGTCGAIIFESYRSTSTDAFLPLNAYDYQAVEDPALSQYYNAQFGNTTLPLKQSMCMNNLYIENAMNSLASTVPTAMVQPYQECQATAMAALIRSVGK